MSRAVNKSLTLVLYDLSEVDGDEIATPLINTVESFNLEPNHQRNEESRIQFNNLSTDPNVIEPLNHFTAIQPLDHSTVTKSPDHPTVIKQLNQSIIFLCNWINRLISYGFELAHKFDPLWSDLHALLTLNIWHVDFDLFRITGPCFMDQSVSAQRWDPSHVFDPMNPTLIRAYSATNGYFISGRPEV